MAQSLADLQAAIQAISDKVDEDLAQTALVITAVNALIAKINASGNTDFTSEVAALAAITTKLTSDNASLQAVIDAGTTASA